MITVTPGVRDVAMPCFDPPVSVDIAICGLGPAGRALAHRCLARGMSVLAVDPNPRRHWHATYAAWSDELPDWLDRSAVAATVTEPRAHGLRDHIIPRSYSVLDTGRLQQSLDLAGATLISGRAVSLGRQTVTLDSGLTLRANRVVDARGLRRGAQRAEQTAYGLMLSADAAPGPALFMDWRPDNGADPGAPPSFLYAVPLGGDTILYEETCLVGRPALAPKELARRLHHRLRARDIAPTPGAPIERVRFPVTGGRPGARRFGAAGGYLHPATGYSVAASLSAADAVAAGDSGWTLAAHTVHRLRRAGLRALLALPPADVPRFFDAFFDLDIELQRAYLSRRDDPVGTLCAMSELFFAVPIGVRARLTAATLGLRPLSLRRSRSAIME